MVRMWPLDRAARTSLDGVAGPARVVLDVRVGGAASVRSPISGRMAAFVQVALFETGGRSIGGMVLGDLVPLEVVGADASIDLLVRRATLEPEAPRAEPVSLEDPVPAELVPLLRGAAGRGALRASERLFQPGDVLVLRAVVEPSPAGGLRRFALRTDLAPVVLEVPG